MGRGAGKRNRGYGFNFVRGSDMPLFLYDGDNQVQAFSRSTFDSLNIDTDAIATTKRHYSFPGCITESFDVLVIDDDEDWESWTWTDSLPSWASAGDFKVLPSIMIHEFGHGLSFGGTVSAHIATLAVMERHFAAESGGQFRLNEDDYVAMTVLKGDGSTGKNFMLSKWVSPDDTNRNQREMWRSSNDAGTWFSAWQVSAGGSLPVGDGGNGANDDPGPIAVIVNGTASVYDDVPVVWTISSDAVCFDGDDIVVGTRTVDISSNAPYIVGPSGNAYSVPIGTAQGPYWLCAGIDPYGTLSETDTTDNVIISERLIQVVP